MPALFALVGLVSSAVAAVPAVPSRQIPPAVLVELQQLENRFELALASDCDAERCFSRGCAYVDHAVADQPRSTSLPGLGMEAGPGSVASQEFLTQARCSFAHERTEESKDVQTLVRRLESKLSSGWTVVSVDNEVLQPLAPYMRDKPEPVVEEDPEEATEEVLPPEEEVDPWTSRIAGRELWASLLPHFYWMIGLFLVSLFGTLLIWAWRRVGQASFEEQALLATLGQAGPEATPTVEVEGGSEEELQAEADRAFVVEQDALWRARLSVLEAEGPDAELHALTRDLLRAGDLPLLAKAVLHFPETFPRAFPIGGDVAKPKLELAEYLKTVDAAALPADADFFRALNRHALAAALSASGLADLIGRLPPRLGALLFALAPTAEQVELSPLLSPPVIAGLCEQLLRSNRMDPSETAALFQVLGAEGSAESLAASLGEVSDRGAAFDAVGALSVLLPRLPRSTRDELFVGALRRFQGTLPSWHRGIFLPDMLFALSDEARVDLLLEVDVEGLAAWVSLLDGDERRNLLNTVPESLRNSLLAVSSFPSRARQLAQAERGRRELARAFQRQLGRAGLSFEEVVLAGASGAP